MYSIQQDGSKVVYCDDEEGVTIAAPRQECLGLLGFREPAPLSRPEDFHAAFLRPVGTGSLGELARGAGRVALIVSDSTRGVPTRLVLPILLEELASAGIRKEDITVVIATGVHRPATADEIDDIVGRECAEGLNVISHDPYNPEKLVFVGTTSYGTLIEVNRTAYEADLRIAVGKVEPHEFAGFSGGRKSVLPGIASERTIEINHRPEMLMSPEARPGRLDGNPIHLDMLEAAAMVKIHFAVNMVLNQAGETIGLFTGGLEEAHLAAVSFMRSFCRVDMKESPDIIVTTPGRPLNINFYQSVKPLIALAPVMKRGGVLVLYSSCRDGLGSEDLLIPYEGAKNIGEVIDRLKSEYRIQMDHALLLGKILQQGVGIVVATPGVDAAILRMMFLSPAASPQEALEKAMNMVRKPRPKVCFFPQAQRALSVPG